MVVEDFDEEPMEGIKRTFTPHQSYTCSVESLESKELFSFGQSNSPRAIKGLTLVVGHQRYVGRLFFT